MTWHSIFDLHTMEHRHLLASYVAVWVIQGGYLAWICRSWLYMKDRPRG
jgi:hypothetical protein